MNIVERSKDILLQVGAAPILYLMIALSVMSIAVMLERAWFFFVSSEDLGRMASALDERLAAGDLAGARALTDSSRSVEGAIVRAGLVHGERGADAASEAMASATAIGRLRLERRLSFLGTLGNNAPFVGLLGTVIGIVQAFHELEQAGMGGSASANIMGAIAEALVATAIGLAVAIPAVAAFNYFQRRIKTTLGNAEALEHIVLSHLLGTPMQPERAANTSVAPRQVRLSLGSVPFETAPSIER
jgi:biopolymer transport protein ExbB